MYGYVFAAAKHNMWHRIDPYAMIYPGAHALSCCLGSRWARCCCPTTAAGKPPPLTPNSQPLEAMKQQSSTG